MNDGTDIIASYSICSDSDLTGEVDVNRNSGAFFGST